VEAFDDQIKTVGQPSPLTPFQLIGFSARAERIKQLGRELDRIDRTTILGNLFSSAAYLAPVLAIIEFTKLGFSPDWTRFFIRRPQELPYGVSDPEIQKKVFGPRWEHELEKQGWPLWKKLLHRLQRCPICKPKNPSSKES